MVNPAAGTYTVEVDGYSVPSGSTQYDYLDAFYSPGLGTLSVPATSVALAQGASTAVTGSVTVAAGSSGAADRREPRRGRRTRAVRG